MKKDKSLLPKMCIPCEGNAMALTLEEVNTLLGEVNGWELLEEKKIVKNFKFKNFVEAKYMVDLIAELAEKHQHHPIILLDYNKLKITLLTHAVNGLTKNDFILAKDIDQLAILTGREKR